MAYIDSNYGNELETALRKLVSRPALGQPWFGFHKSEVPAGVLLFTATTHSRALYADFWQYIRDKNLVKTEEEWQAICSEQGWCPFYSDGDGIDTFRMPSAPLYLCGATTLSEAGAYVAEGLPNITGELPGTYMSIGEGVDTSNGVFRYYAVSGNRQTGSGRVANIEFDASRSSAVYGNSQHVIPATSKLLFGVWAVSTAGVAVPDANAEEILSQVQIATSVASVAQASADAALAGLSEIADGVAKPDLSNVTDPVQEFKTKSVRWGIPDYTAGVTLTAGTDHVMTYPAFIVVRNSTQSNSGFATARIYVNGVTIATQHGYLNSYKATSSVCAFVDTGDTVKGYSTSGTTTTMTAYPLKGVGV